MKKKKLTRSRSNRMILGVFGGIAEYFNWNAKYLRVGYLIFTLICMLAYFFGILIPVLLYIGLGFLIPEEKGTGYFDFMDFFNQATSRENQQQDKPKRKIIKAKEHDVIDKDDK